jgi:hypothetical protein
MNFLSEAYQLSQICLSVLGQTLGKQAECERVKMLMFEKIILRSEIYSESFMCLFMTFLAAYLDPLPKPICIPVV